MTLRLGSLFAGIGGFDLGFHRAGIQPVWAVEIDPACRRVLRHHNPDVALYEDVREVGAHNLEPVDIITFGSPCQDLSVAGKRKGLDGERSGLYFEAIRIISELGPAIAVWENVPGALSSHSGRDFGRALDELADIGALDIAWAVLDAQWFGVAQRRRRVFVVADFRGERAGEILALADGLSGHPAPRRETGEDVAGTLGGGAGERGWAADTDRMTFVPTKAHAVTCHHAKGGDPTTDNYVAHTLSAEGHDASEDGTGRGTPLIAFQQNQRDEVRDLGDLAGALSSQPGMKQQNYIAFTGKDYGADAGDIDPTLRAMPHDKSHATGRNAPNVSINMAVRRLTPTECERLQGFPDGWTALDGVADSTRYRQLGNAVAVPVTEWLGRRIIAAHIVERIDA